MIDVQHHDSPSSSENSRYQDLDSKLRASTFDGSAAQAHGIASGLVCRNVAADDLIASTEHLNFTDDTSISALESLVEMSRRDLNQAEFAFDLWLPEVDDLAIQLDALAEWSQGYILGLMYDGNTFMENLKPELIESIDDIIAIAGLESTGSQETEDEVAFIEVREYLRMATQLLFEELNPDLPIGQA